MYMYFHKMEVKQVVTNLFMNHIYIIYLYCNIIFVSQTSNFFAWLIWFHQYILVSYYSSSNYFSDGQQLVKGQLANGHQVIASLSLSQETMNSLKMIEFVLHVRCKSCVMFANPLHLACLCFRVLNSVKLQLFRC